MNTESREDWYEAGEGWEKAFVASYGETFGVILNPAKEKYKWAPDLFILKNSEAADLKFSANPFYKAEEKYGIPAQHAFSFNVSDFFEYCAKRSDRFGLFFWRSWLGSEKYGVSVTSVNEVYYCTLAELKHLVEREGKIHHYIRRGNDTNGNAYGSIGIDLRKLTRIS